MNDKGLKILLVSLVCVIGLTIGGGIFTFINAKGLSYMSNDPKSCANCHVMQGTYDSWQKGGHQHAATCGDCHLPHDSFIAKWYTKAENGWHHSLAFTLGNLPENFAARPESKQIAQNNCIRCHSDFASNAIHTQDGAVDPLKCTSCHKNVGHTH